MQGQSGAVRHLRGGKARAAIWTRPGGCAITHRMDRKPSPPGDRNPRGAPAADPRAQRLKAALKANLARRKAQARARDAAPAQDPPTDD